MSRPKGSKNGKRNLISKTCEICGKTFCVSPFKSITSRFCSKECVGVWKSKELLGNSYRTGKYTVQQTISKSCPICQRDFTVHYRSLQKYCSKECRNKRVRMHYVKPNHSICQNCGKEFDYPHHHKPRLYCSKSCHESSSAKFRSKQEKEMFTILSDLNVPFEPQFKIKRYRLDFAIPTQKIDVECDGEYWHDTPKARERDYRRDKFMEQNGWLVLRFSDTLMNTDINQCIQRISQALSPRNFCPRPTQ